ncbi:hypothetical protein HHK36_002333 [Tetracentron sinense]|uniref:Uncharacterized protein n=1 Tax=Tetracentron sinense TaxID=13715 RepID=A0A835DVX5_TETSI|nr:hypothetical protein HHK36_002333 [Tetracentron sinense]
MLSVENPPDPSCYCKISGLKTDEGASDKLSLQEEEDHLLKSGLDDNHPPNFSIRDYVTTARSKDIKTNWPFPQQYLQLCLKHGIKNLLPPFEPPDSVRNRCFRKGEVYDQLVVRVDGRKGVVEVDPFEKENISSFNGESSRSSDLSVLGSTSKAQSQEKLTLGPTDTNLCVSIRSPSLDQVGGGEFPSTVNRHPQSERESVPNNRLPCCSAQEANTLCETSVELEVSESPTASHQTGNTTGQSGKKCRLIVKLGIISDPSRTEDITSNTTTVPEPMASKVCPVCKTFSSTSNTTLNAHIDQCLAVESNSKWAVNNKLSKHRVKPRKMRSMVDIYVAAPRCTLEELDRRNGSKWATDLSLSTQHVEVQAEEKRQRVSRMNLEDTDDESAVYIDPSGKKLRILSKFNDASVPTVGEIRSRKHMKEFKESKIMSTSKKRRLAPKHPKYLKLKPQSEKLCSLKPGRTEIPGAREGNYGKDENRKEESLFQLLKAHDQTRPSKSGTLRQWVCSKRTGILKKINGKDGHRGHGDPSLVTQDPLIECNQSNLRDSCVRSCTPKFSNSAENPITSPRSKRVESPLQAQITDSVKKFPNSLESNMNQLSKGITSMHDSCILRRAKSSENHASSLRSKRAEIYAGPVQNSDSLPKATMNLYKSCHRLSTKGRKLSTFRKDVLSVAPYFPKSKFHENERCLAFKKPRVHSSEVDEGYDWMHSHTENTENRSGSFEQIEGNHKSDCSNNVLRSTIEEITERVYYDRSNVLESIQEREAVSTSEREEAIPLESFQFGPQCCGYDPEAIMDSPVAVSDILADKCDGLESTGNKVPINEEMVLEPYSRKSVGEPVVRSSKLLVLELHKMANASETLSNSLLLMEEHQRPSFGTEAPIKPTELSFSNDQEMCCVDEVGDGVIGQNTHMGAEVDYRLEGGNSFYDVDTVLIPGPPGSFSPSHGHMDSEVLQDNSSLTSCRVLSSEDQHNLFDRDSSGSPISSISAISHLSMARSDLKYLEPEPSIEPPAIRDKIIPNFSDGSIEPAVGDAITFPCTASKGARRINLNSVKLKVNKSSAAKRPENFAANDQPCCCSRKEGISHGATVDYQESQLLGKCVIAPVTLPAKGKQLSCNANIRPETFTSFSTYPISRTDEVAIPVLESPTGSTSMKASPGARKFPSLGDCDSASPSSTSNPVLRLMGKNLMVVNKDEDISMRLRQAQAVASNDHPNPKCSALPGFSTGDFPNQHLLSCHLTAPNGSVICSQNVNNPLAQCFDVRSSNGLRSHGNSKAHQIPTQSSARNCPDLHIGGFEASLPQHGLKVALQTQQKTPNNRLNAPFMNVVERIIANPQIQHHNAVSATQTPTAVNPIPEVIVINDSPENEANSTMISAKYTEELRGTQRSPACIQTPTDSNSSLRQVNTFSCYQLQNPFHLREPPLGSKPSFLLSPPKGANSRPPKSGATSEGGNLLRQNPFMVLSPAPGHLSSAVYYSPSLS